MQNRFFLASFRSSFHGAMVQVLCRLQNGKTKTCCKEIYAIYHLKTTEAVFFLTVSHGNEKYAEPNQFTK